MIRAARRAASLGLLLASLTACGGGGGAPPLAVTLDRGSLTWSGMVGSTFVQKSINVTVSGGEGSYYGVVGVDRPDVFETTFTPTGGNSASINFLPWPPRIGKVSGQVTLSLCPDAACRTVAWSKVIPYTITAFSLEPASLALSAVEGQDAPPQVITVSPASEGGALDLAIEDVAGAGVPPPWLTLTRTSPSTWQVVASGAGQLAGAHQARLVATQSRVVLTRVPVAFDLARGILPIPDGEVTLGAGAVSAEVPLDLAVSFAGGLAPAWTATSDQPWLHVAAPPGPGAGTLGLVVDGSALGALPNWSATAATVTVSAPGLTPATAQVTVRKQLAEVRMVHPAAVRAGQAGTLRVFGRGFAALQSADAVAVAGAPGATCAVVSDRELAVTLPALAAGRAEVRVKNPFGADTGASAVAAVGSAWAAELVAQAGEKRSAVLDASREAVFAVDRTQDALVRYRRGAAGWQVDLLPIGSVGDAGLSPDRRTVWVTKGGTTLLEVDPDSLAIRSTRPVNDFDLRDAIEVTRSGTTGLQATNDGRLWFNTGSPTRIVYLDQASGTLQRYAGPNESASPYGLNGLASPDGSRLAVKADFGGDAWLYSAATSGLSPTTLPPHNFLSGFSADGGLLVTDLGTVYRAPDWALVGTGAVDEPGFGSLSALSPDGTRLYRVAMQAVGFDYVVARLDVFDTTALTPGTTQLPKLGELPVAGTAGTCPVNGPSGCSPVPFPLMSPLGDAVFLVGNQGLVVVPIPPELRGG